MRRKEKKQGWMFVILSCLLVLSVFVSGFRVAIASKDLRPQDIIAFADIYGVITDRFEQPIYENGKVKNYNIFGNVIGDGSKIHNSLVYRYSDELKPGSVNFISGYRNVEEKPRIMRTTLLAEESLSEIAKLYGSNKGCCFAYNYETGEVYAALSFPAYNPVNKDTEFINRCFDSLYIPGSTMKVVTTVLAVEQDIKLDKITYECNGEYVLPSGEKIACAYKHGTVDYAGAIGKSCNGYFVKVASEFNMDEALETFRDLGFQTNEEKSNKIETADFRRMMSSVRITNTSSYSNAWAFAGQGKDEVNPVHMAMIAGAIANDGKAAEPYIVKSIYNQDKDKFIYEADESEMTKLMSSKTASTVAKLWKTGVDKYYYGENYGLSKKITYAKTGTAQKNDNKAENNRLLMGVIEESKTAFYIVVESHSDKLPFMVANKLTEIISRQ